MTKKNESALPVWLLPVAAVLIVLAIAVGYTVTHRDDDRHDARDNGPVAMAPAGEAKVERGADDDTKASLVATNAWPVDDDQDRVALQSVADGGKTLNATTVEPSGLALKDTTVASDLSYALPGGNRVQVYFTGASCDPRFHMYAKETDDAVYLAVVQGFARSHVGSCAGDATSYSYMFTLKEPVGDRAIRALPVEDFKSKYAVKPGRGEAVIIGTVVDQRGNKVASCPVEIDRERNDAKLVTDANGQFRIAVKPGREVEIQAECGRTDAQEGEVKVYVDDTSTRHVTVYLGQDR